MAVLNIIERDAGEVEVWCDVPGAEMAGIIIGLGESRAAAMADAVRTCEALIEQLQSPPDVWQTDQQKYYLWGHKGEFSITTHRFAGDI